jgi:UDP-galactopyranose mutase
MVLESTNKHIVVGSGFCGSIIARLIAEKLGSKVTLFERRNHIAGNMFDETDENGILVQRYGPHAFHTNSERVHQFIHQYGEWTPYKLTCKADIRGRQLPTPFNFEAVDFLYEPSKAAALKDAFLRNYPGEEKKTILELLASEDPLIREYAELLYEEDYCPYTAKQWGLAPNAIDKSVLRRVPLWLSDKDQYFDDKYQYLPKGGFTSFFSNLLNHPNIEVKLNTDVKAECYIDWEKKEIFTGGEKFNGIFVFTGALDELLDYKYGCLPYRALKFEYQTKLTDSFQNAPVVAYPMAEGYTRITEYNKIPIQSSSGKTTIAVEYPLSYAPNSDLTRYYPIPAEENTRAHSGYAEEIKKLPNFHACGRLADYKYYNMDNAIERALDVFSEIERKI